MSEWYCTFHYPDNWIEVPHRGAGAPAGALPSLTDQVQQAVARTFAGEAPDRQERLAAVMAPLMQADAERGAAISAHGYDEDMQGFPVHMHMAMWVTERSHPDSVDEELALLADTAQSAGMDVEPPEVTDVSLPAGRALRVRQLAKGTMAADSASVVESVDYWLPVVASQDLLWAHFWTPNLAFSGDLVALFDQMAEAIVVESV